MLRNVDEDTVFAEDAFIADVQFALHNLMERKGTSHADLARALFVSEARISQMFNHSARNLTLRTLARVFYVLREEPQITSPCLRDILPSSIASEDEPGERADVGGPEAFAPDILPIYEGKIGHRRFTYMANDNLVEDDLVADAA